MLRNSKIQSLMKEFNANLVEQLLWIMYVRLGMLEDRLKEQK